MAIKLGLPSSNLHVKLRARLFKRGIVIEQAAREFEPYVLGGSLSRIVPKDLYDLLYIDEKNRFYAFLHQNFPGVPLPDYVRPSTW